MPYKFSYIVASNCYIYATWGCSSVGRALEWHSRGQRFDPAQLHTLNQRSTSFVRGFFIDIYNGLYKLMK